MNITLEAGRAWCDTAHGPQKYGNEPYSVHLDAVEAVLVEFGVATYYNRLKARGHDVFEDNKSITPAHMMSQRFPIEVVRGCWRLKDPAAKDRAERKRLLYIQLAGHWEDILVKLADRIANWRVGEKAAMYQSEYPQFRQALYNKRHKRAKALWAALDEMYARGNMIKITTETTEV